MLERATSQIEQPISVEIGQTFMPFEGLKELPLPGEHKTFVESVDYVASREFEFNGIKVTISLTVSEDHFSPDLPRGFETPLGETTLEHQYKDGEEVTVKTPLQITIFSTLDSINDFIVLGQYKANIKIGDTNYSLDCMELLHEDEAQAIIEAKEIIENGLENDWGGGHFVSRDLKDNDGNDVTVALPYDAPKLSTIEVKMTRKT